MSELDASFWDVVGPMRGEFAVDPLSGQLLRRRRSLLDVLVRGLAVLGCVQGHAMLTPAATLADEPGPAFADAAGAPPQHR